MTALSHVKNGEISGQDHYHDSTPGALLKGARYKEGMSQEQLSQASGIARRHISEMESNRRSIGKERARRLAEVLKVDYRVFLKEGGVACVSPGYVCGSGHITVTSDNRELVPSHRYSGQLRHILQGAGAVGTAHDVADRFDKA